MADFLDADGELRALKELFDELFSEHEWLQQKRPIDVVEHERHRAKIRALTEAIQDWRAKHSQ